jgi:RimJ/RimL family protein N-acetyltransferase
MKTKESKYRQYFTDKKGNEITIRPAILEDSIGITDAVKTIIQKGNYIQKEKTKSLQEEKEFIQLMQESRNLYAVIELQGEVVGIIRVMRGELEMKNHTGVFRTWLVDKARGLGIGKMILVYTFDWCEKNNLHKLWLTVFSSNKIAISLYEKYGFQIEGVQKDQLCINGKYEDEIYMAKFFK